MTEHLSRPFCAMCRTLACRSGAQVLSHSLFTELLGDLNNLLSSCSPLPATASAVLPGSLTVATIVTTLLLDLSTGALCSHVMDVIHIWVLNHLSKESVGFHVVILSQRGEIEHPEVRNHLECVGALVDLEREGGPRLPHRSSGRDLTDSDTPDTVSRETPLRDCLGGVHRRSESDTRGHETHEEDNEVDDLLDVLGGGCHSEILTRSHSVCTLISSRQFLPELPPSQ